MKYKLNLKYNGLALRGNVHQMATGKAVRGPVLDVSVPGAVEINIEGSYSLLECLFISSWLKKLLK